MIFISTFNERANRLAEHILFKSTHESREKSTYHLRGDDGGMGFTHIDMTHAVSQTTVTLTGKRTGRVLQLIGVSEADTHNDVIERLNTALASDLPDDETALLDVLADYFDEEEKEDMSETDAPDDALIIVLDDKERIIDVVGLPEEEERRFVLIRTTNDGSIGVIPVTSPMNYNIENRDDLLRMFNAMAKENAQRLQEMDDETTP